MLNEESGATYFSHETYLGKKTEGIKPIGSMYEPSLERILLLKPDLILALDLVKHIYPLLSQIAPTVMISSGDPSTWKERFNFIAEVLGKQAAAQQALNHYYQRVEELKIALGNRFRDQTISVVSVFSDNRTLIFAKNSFAGSILDDLGLQRPPIQNVVTPYGNFSSISEEKLEVLDADLLFCLVFGDGNKEAFERLQQKPLWKKLKAVQQEQVYLVDGWAWHEGKNPLAANVIINDLYKYLVNAP